MNRTINEIKQEIFGKVYEVYEIFQNFFGEQFVDLQEIPDDTQIVDAVYACTEITEIEPEASLELPRGAMSAIKRRFTDSKPVIMVWWPRVTVTNENDRSIQIQDLYAKIKVTLEGRIPYEFCGFQLTRTTFPEIQYTSGYCHSHVPHFSGVPSFQRPCLGTGPINNTIMDLKNGCEEALWMLFCQELALYVTVESLAGGPYFRMENIGSRRRLSGYGVYTTVNSLQGMSSIWRNTPSLYVYERIKDFTKYYLEHGHLSFNFIDGKFVSGMPYFDYMIDISNSFIDFYNSYSESFTESVVELFEKNILRRAFAANNEFYTSDEIAEHHDFSAYEGRYLLTFKGEAKNLHIEREAEFHVEITTVLNHNIAMYILCSILKIINYRYRNEHTTSTGTSEGSTPTYQRVVYL